MSQNPESTEVKYFQSWSGYSIPKKPQTEISVDDLDNYSTYYKAIYANNLILRFEKYTNKELVGLDEYEYWEDTDILKKHTLVNNLDEKRVHHYDSQGKKIKQ